MVKTPFDSARVIWSSSLEASPKFYDSEDWQLTKTRHSYESSKYQIDIIAINLDRMALNSNEGKSIRHFISEPGICSTSISRALVSGILDYIKTILFYLVSLLFLYLFLVITNKNLGSPIWFAISFHRSFQSCSCDCASHPCSYMLYTTSFGSR
jgi:hypothetical protein